MRSLYLSEVDRWGGERSRACAWSECTPADGAATKHCASACTASSAGHWTGNRDCGPQPSPPPVDADIANARLPEEKRTVRLHVNPCQRHMAIAVSRYQARAMPKGLRMGVRRPLGAPMRTRRRLGDRPRQRTLRALVPDPHSGFSPSRDPPPLPGWLLPCSRPPPARRTRFAAGSARRDRQVSVADARAHPAHADRPEPWCRAEQRPADRTGWCGVPAIGACVGRVCRIAVFEVGGRWQAGKRWPPRKESVRKPTRTRHRFVERRSFAGSGCAMVARGSMFEG